MNETTNYIDKSVVLTSNGNGWGIVVNEMVITAASCVSTSDFSNQSMEEVQTLDGQRCYAQVRFIDFASDLALLGSPNSDRMPVESRRYQDWVKQVPSAQLFRGPVVGDFPVFIRNNEGNWITGKCVSMNDILFVAASEPFKAASLGGPIITEEGGLLSIVPRFTEPSCHSSPVFEGPYPFISRTMPIWFISISSFTR